MTTERTAPIAYVSPDRQIHVLDAHGVSHPQTAGGDPALVWGTWAGSSQTTHSWPSWSPDGRHLACFAVADEAFAHALVLEVNGMQSAAVSTLSGRLPIYLYWSPDGEHIALLTQQVEPGQDRLQLAVANAQQAGSEVLLAQGSPLFFTWVDRRLAAFIGDPSQGETRLSIFSPEADGPRTLLPGQPGNFCAPVWARDSLVYVLQHGKRATVGASGLDDPEPRTLETLDGLVALLRSPDGRSVARAVASGGDGTPYRELAVLDIESGRATPVTDEPCLAFFWLPDGSGLITARVDTERNLMRWHRVGLDGTQHHICDMFPTRDFGFYLRFFEQYAQSHSIVDPTSRNLLLVGGLVGQGDPHRTHALWEVPLDGGEPERLAEAVFGVYGPQVELP